VVWIAPATDVALIVLPESVDKDAPVFFGSLPSKLVVNRLEFHLYGWPKWARTYDGEQAMAGGRVIPGKIHLGDYSPDDLLVLEPERLPDAPSDPYESQWEGISGAAVLCNGLVVAVQHRHQNTNRRASLEAIPLSKVYDDPGWRETLNSHGIDTKPTSVEMIKDNGQSPTSTSLARVDYCDRVAKAIECKLNRLDDKYLELVAAGMDQLARVATSGINLGSKKEILVKQIASCMVHYCPVTPTVAHLVGLMSNMAPETKGSIADIIDDILPLNFAPNVIQQLRQQIDEDHFGLVENEVTTWTLAEIIMAGYDQKPTTFVVQQGRRDPRGKTSTPYNPGPEIGPDIAESGHIDNVSLAVRDVLYHLIDLIDEAPQFESHINVKLQIDEMVGILTELLNADHNIQQRHLYYVLRLPPQGSPKRAFQIEVIRHICQQIPLLMFVELAQIRKHEGEREIARYIHHIQEDVRLQLVRP
jgi:hypothetical protein